MKPIMYLSVNIKHGSWFSIGGFDSISITDDGALQLRYSLPTPRTVKYYLQTIESWWVQLLFEK